MVEGGGKPAAGRSGVGAPSSGCGRNDGRPVDPKSRRGWGAPVVGDPAWIQPGDPLGAPYS